MTMGELQVNSHNNQASSTSAMAMDDSGIKTESGLNSPPPNSINKNLANMEKIDNDRLILSVKEAPYLYDTSHRDYKDTTIKSQAWETIAQLFDVTR